MVHHGEENVAAEATRLSNSHFIHSQEKETRQGAMVGCKASSPSPRVTHFL